MRKTVKTMLALMAGALTFSACSSDEFANTESANTTGAKLVTLTAYQDNDVTSRAVINGMYINWESGDAIGVFATTGSPTQYTTTASGSTSAEFTTTGTPVSGASMALYPYQSTAIISDSKITATLPATQTAKSGSFDTNAALMVGSVNGTTVNFKNAVAYIKITTGFECKSIAIQNVTNGTTGYTSDQTMAGDAVISLSNEGTVSTTMGTNKTQRVLLTAASGNLASDTYYIAILPQTNVKLALQVTSTDGNLYQKTLKNAKSFEANTVTDFGTFSNLAAVSSKVTTTGSVDGHDWVQLWSGGPKFATVNVGATNPQDYGDYFAWGATTPWYESGHSQENPCSNWISGKTGYDWASAPFNNGQSSYSSDYFSNTGRATATGSATGTTLVSTYDAATANWGSSWKMPTMENFNGLKNTSNCTWSWDSTKNGYTITGKTTGYTSNSIFLPAAGCRSDTRLLNASTDGNYWSSTLYSGQSKAYLLNFYSSNKYVDQSDRYFGLSVRAVLK